MKRIDPLKLFLWTFRRNEKDVINLYDSLSDVMTLATNGDMINFGYWDKKTTDPITAQKKLCSLFAKMAKLESHDKILDVGCGYASPAIQWHEMYSPIEFFCININMKQLRKAQNNPLIIKKSKIQEKGNGIHLINATATRMPFISNSMDKILAFESAQHFKPLASFLNESKRILKKNGILALAIPVLTSNSSPILKLGLLTMTWSSEHYAKKFVLRQLQKTGFTIINQKMIGSNVYAPLADYYFKHRQIIAKRLEERYPKFVENILNKSMQKMKQVSDNGIIEYLIIISKKSYF